MGDFSSAAHPKIQVPRALFISSIVLFLKEVTPLHGVGYRQSQQNIIGQYCYRQHSYTGICMRIRVCLCASTYFSFLNSRIKGQAACLLVYLINLNLSQSLGCSGFSST